MKYIVIGVLLTFAFSAYSQDDNDWKRVWSGKDGTVYYFNTRRLRRDGNLRETWIKRKTGRFSSESYDHSITLQRFRCDTLEARWLSATYYNERGTVLRQTDFEADGLATWVQSPPDSVGERVVKAVCSYHDELDEIIEKIEKTSPAKPSPTPTPKNRRPTNAALARSVL